MPPKSPKPAEERRITDSELRHSIAQFGCFLPVLRWKGRTLDGRRRERIAMGVGKECRVVELRTRKEAASALWMVHPERCLTTFPEPTLAEAAELYGTSPAMVALVKQRIQPRAPSYPPGRMPWHRRRTVDHIPYQTEGRALDVRFRISPELREAMRLARGDECSEAAFIRRAIARACEDKGKAPT